MTSKEILTEALNLLDKVRIEPGRENRMRMALAEQKIMSCMAQLDRAEKEARNDDHDHDEQGQEHAGSVHHADGKAGEAAHRNP